MPKAKKKCFLKKKQFISDYSKECFSVWSARNKRKGLLFYRISYSCLF